MIRWNNDYNRMAHPEVLRVLSGIEQEAYPGYGEDEWCERAADLIRELGRCPDAGVYFFAGATQANLTVVAAALRPAQSVICADTGHILVHEAGSIEATGHKLTVLPAENGKLSAAVIAQACERYYGEGQPDYSTHPRLVYLSFATELGTVYTLDELEAIHKVCRRYGLRLFMDGARLGYGLGAAGCDVTLPDLCRLCDALYIGLTKCGAMFGEAVILTDASLREDFRPLMKQRGAVLAKGWLMGAQAYALLKDGLYFSVTRCADELAAVIRDAFVRKGVPLYVISPTNQQFVILTAAQRETLARGHVFEKIEELDDDRWCVRFCTSWATKKEDVDVLVRDIEAL